MCYEKKLSQLCVSEAVPACVFKAILAWFIIKCVIICYLLCLKSRSGLHLKKANSACMFRKIYCMYPSIFHLRFIRVFVICIFVKCAVFVFVLINVQVLYWSDSFCEKAKQGNVHDVTGLSSHIFHLTAPELRPVYRNLMV